MHKKYGFVLVLLSLLILGCAHKPTPFLPLKAISTQISSKILEDKKDQAILQVLIMYSSSFCAHTALRLSDPENGAVFWDPAGGYGLEGSVSVKRNKDLIVNDAPTLNNYIRFRTEIPTKTVEIFEWKITQETANKFYTILINGTDRFHTKGKFSTQGQGFFCGADVSDFLNRFGTDFIQVKKIFFPHDLERQLYLKLPDRVIIVDIDMGKIAAIREIHQAEKLPFEETFE